MHPQSRVGPKAGPHCGRMFSWYLAYPLSARHVEERMLERGVHVDHSTVNRWHVARTTQIYGVAFTHAGPNGAPQAASTQMHMQVL